MTAQSRKILAVAAAVLVIGSIVGFSVARERGKRVQVQTGKVARTELTQVVTASGEVRPRRYVNVGANVSGRIVELAVREGDRVKKGQVLARIESERFEAGARQSEAAVAAARAELQHANADLEVSRLVFDRTKKMHEDRLIADQAFDQAEAELKMKAANVEAAHKRVAQLQAQLDSTRDELYKTTMYSPMDGVVTSLPKEAGEMVIGALSFNPTVIMTVADLLVMECEVMVDETDIRNLSLGQKAEVRVDALEGVRIEGEVTEIGASALARGTGSTQQVQATLGATTGNQPKDFKVKIVLKDPPPSLRPGLNATAGPEPREGNTVTQLARPKGEEKDGVFLVKDGKAVFTPVKAGIMGETDIEILEGLGEGQEIVTGSYKTLRTLKDQARIRIEKKGKRS